MSEDLSEERKDQMLENTSARMAHLRNSQDWKMAKELLVKKILSATSLLDMSEADRRNPVVCEANAKAGELVGQWIRDIDGEELLHDTIEATEPDENHVLQVRTS